METYFITGLPRSRTTWLANFFNYKDSFCFHDGLKKCIKVEDLETIMKARPEQYVGNSDSGLPLIIDDIHTLLSESKIVIVERNLEECIEESRNVFCMGNDLAKPMIEHVVRLTQARLQDIKIKYNPCIIQYEELEHINLCEEMWNYLLPTIPFPKDRWFFLNELNVTINLPKYMKEIVDDKKALFLTKYFN